MNENLNMEHIENNNHIKNMEAYNQASIKAAKRIEIIKQRKLKNELRQKKLDVDLEKYRKKRKIKLEEKEREREIRIANISRKNEKKRLRRIKIEVEALKRENRRKRLHIEELIKTVGVIYKDISKKLISTKEKRKEKVKIYNREYARKRRAKLLKEKNKEAR